MFTTPQKTVLLGAHNVREEFEEGRLELVSENWFAHPKWSQIGIRNDIGLIQLPYKINFTDIISPICLPSYSDVSDDFAGLDVSKIIYKQMLNVCPLMVVKNRFQFHEKTSIIFHSLGSSFWMGKTY